MNELMLKYGLVEWSSVNQSIYNMIREKCAFSMFTYDQLKIFLNKNINLKRYAYLSTGFYELVLFDEDLTFMEVAMLDGKFVSESWDQALEFRNRNKENIDKLFFMIPKPFKMLAYERYNWDNVCFNTQIEILMNVRKMSEYRFEEFDKKFVIPFLKKNHSKIVDTNNKSVITVYRGESSKSLGYKNSISWTKDINIAKMFSSRFVENTVRLYSAEVKMCDILAEYESESEVLVEASKLSKVKLLEDIK